jgi:membrane-anchored glycerophosphoryl diester phosphodiesterase (GDPDase)
MSWLKTLRSWGFRRWALVLLAVVAAALARVVAMAGTILLVPLAHIDDIACVVVVANVVVDGWGLVPRFLLFWVD